MADQMRVKSRLRGHRRLKGGRTEEDAMNRSDGPPRLLFSEWWLELRDDLKLAGALFNCYPARDPQVPSEVERTMFVSLGGRITDDAGERGAAADATPDHLRHLV